MNPDINKVYQKLFDAYKKSHREISAQQSQINLNKIWKELKEFCHTKLEIAEKAEAQIKEYTSLFMQKTSKNILFFLKKPGSNFVCSTQAISCSSLPSVSSLNVSSSEHSTIAIANNSQVTSNNNEVLSITTGTKKRKITTSAQDTIRLKIRECESQLNFKVGKRDAGFGDDENRRNIRKIKVGFRERKIEVKDSTTECRKTTNFQK
ncbi:hypothetical protein KQX54_011930 [Cotesia glomerata]|uniref:Uncharacterized protein n=1 Tax=Cotesia glomerata TaxID=32391 RepID=A0AAV7IZZ7_COTGL|nr:hypothetical protein KQX54_011930 [Cotesia glomerata]